MISCISSPSQRVPSGKSTRGSPAAKTLRAVSNDSRSGASRLTAKDGTAYIALKSRAVIVPVGLGGSDKAMPRHAKFPKRHKVAMVIGEPIDTGALLADGQTRASRTQVTQLSELIKSRLQEVYDKARSEVS